MNNTAKTFLEAYARGQEVEGGWKYAKALQQSQLDYSDASLHRLDVLLHAIKIRAKPSREEMLETVPGQNFCALVAFYVIEVLRRRTAARFDWHDRASALRVLPDGAELPDTPQMGRVVIFPDQGGMSLPLVWVEAQIMSDGKHEKAADYLADVIAQLERAGPAVWWEGMEAAGQMASWQMMMAADGGLVLPLMLVSTAPKKWIGLMAPGSSEDVRSVMLKAERRLEGNPEGAAWQVLGYDGYADVDGVRCDAVMVMMETYGKSPLQLKLAFPYRPAAAGRRFEILDPTLLGANVEGEKIRMLNGALERGIQGIKWVFGKTWNELRKV